MTALEAHKAHAAAVRRKRSGAGLGAAIARQAMAMPPPLAFGCEVRVLELTIPFRLPKGAGGTGARYSRAKASHTDTIALIVKAKHWAPVPRAYFTFRWREKDKRRNPDNVAAGGRKVILDGMVRAGLLPNDGWSQVAGWTDTFEVSPQPGVVVTLVVVES